METIHKKNGRLHIYVRQDKYKGELKSHNWVGRTYINGKQKVSSSGTTNLEEAIPILEKWFDDLQIQKNEVKTEIEQSLDQKIEEKQDVPSLIDTQSTETSQSEPLDETIQTPQKGVTIGMLEKLKKNYFILIITFLFIYFFFNLLDGDRGLISYMEKKDIYKQLKNDQITLNSKIEDLEHKNSLLTENIDLDFIEILIREKFLFGKEGETTYIIKDNGNQK